MMWRNMADSLRTCGLFGKAEVQGGGRRFAFLAVHGRESLEACRLAGGFLHTKNGAALHWAAPFLSIHISRLQRFAFQTLHPVVLRKKRDFSAYCEPVGAVPPPRVPLFSKTGTLAGTVRRTVLGAARSKKEFLPTQTPLLFQKPQLG